MGRVVTAGVLLLAAACAEPERGSSIDVASRSGPGAAPAVRIAAGEQLDPPGPMVRVPVPLHARHTMVYRRRSDGTLVIECVQGHPLDFPPGHPMHEGTVR